LKYIKEHRNWLRTLWGHLSQ